MKYRAPRFLFRRHELMRRTRPGGSFVEIGAADLTLTAELLERFNTGLAVDFSDDLHNSYQKLPAELRERLEISNVNVMTDALPDGFDCVVACEVMEHVEDDAEFLRRLAAILVPGGQLVMSVPARKKFWTVHDELVGHLRRYEKRELIELASAAGLKDVEVTAYGYPWINWLSHLRVWLAKRTLVDRKDWDQQKQTAMSNHRQIPGWLSDSFVPLLVNRFTVYPFALLSRLFNRFDLSDGYVLTARRGF